MSEFLKPTGLNIQWASAGDILDPGDTKYQTGWSVEIPPRQWENYIQNKQDNFIAHANQHGICVWDAETEYQADKSYVQGTTNGTIYRCILTHTNQDPELDVTNTYWIIAFASTGDFYTKTEADGLYLAKAQNLADLTNTATARTNLSVYSQAQTYTKTEVDAKTTVASTAQAQAWTSNTTLLTPLRLKEAFQGSNYSTTASGYQRLPSGLILQWGNAGTFTTNSETKVINFPIAFPTACLMASPLGSQGITSGVVSSEGASTFGTPTTASFNLQSAWESGTGSTNIYWIAIGY